MGVSIPHRSRSPNAKDREEFVSWMVAELESISDLKDSAADAYARGLLDEVCHGAGIEYGSPEWAWTRHDALIIVQNDKGDW